MQDIVKNTIILTVILVAVAFLLSSLYTITKPIIDETYDKIILDNIRRIFPEATFSEDKGDYFEVIDNGELLGYAVISSEYGYSSDIKIMVGYDIDKEIVGLQVLKQQESPGIGTKILDISFLEKFSLTPPDEVDAITGATISSTAVKKAVEKSRGVLP
jgi:Na+-translocating ferredoxin:NAD+ oxidoreductase subunit G